jgi:adenylate cyclase
MGASDENPSRLEAPRSGAPPPGRAVGAGRWETVNKLGRFLHELQRRHVLRVTGFYAVAAWIAVEVSSTVLPLLGHDEEIASFIVRLVIAGFPVTVLLAWFFDITPEGLKRTLPLGLEPAAAAPAAATARPRRRTPLSLAPGLVGLGILIGLVGVGAYAVYRPHPVAEPTGRIESIAVLPFLDLSPAGDQEYFADGVTEELLSRLAYVEGLRVPARTSVFAYKGRNEDVTDIGRRLRVDAVLEGSVRRDGDRVRIHAQLVDARSGFHLWSSTYERSVADLFTMQDEIAISVVEALRLRLSGPVERGGSRNARAIDAYLRGQAHWVARTGADLHLALGLFQEAVREDPDYAAAHAGMALTWAVLPFYSEVPAHEALARGSQAAAEALAIEPNLPEAFAALGQLAQNFQWDIAGAERYYRRALGANAGVVPAQQWHAEALLLLGRLTHAEEAVARAMALDPGAPAPRLVQAILLAVRRDHAGALAAFESLGREHSALAVAHINHALAAFDAGQPERAAAALKAAFPGNAELAGLFDRVAEAAGRGQGSSRQAVEAIRRAEGRLGPTLAGALLAVAGDGRGAVDALRRAFDAHSDPVLPFVLISPVLQPLHGHPGFRDIAREVGVSIPAF